MPDIALILGLLVAVAVLATVARWLALPYPILLVVGGLVLGLVPGLPRVALDPDLVFLLFLPPLVFAAAFFTSWHELRGNLRSVAWLALGLPLATIAGVAAVAHVALTGFDWATAFVLGAVVAPTDTVAAGAIADRLGLPHRLVTVLEDESLFNDAIGLVALRVATAAVVTGSFSMWSAGGAFVLSSVGAVAIGLVVGSVTAWLTAHVEDPPVEITITLLAPFAAYLPADRLGVSGILAAVVAGMYFGWREPRVGTPTTRLRGRAVWDMIVFVLNGLLFVLIGFQLRPILAALSGADLRDALRDAVIVSLAVVAVRILWVFLAAYLPRWTNRQSRADHPLPEWRSVAVVAWTGMRGGVTLAAALAVPLVTDRGAPFPARPTMIFVAFAVILGTLVVQGLSLPPLIRRLGLSDEGTVDRQVALARRTAAEAALERLDALATRGDVPAALTAALRARYAHQVHLFAKAKAGEAGQAAVVEHIAERERILHATLQAERQAVIALRDGGLISDEALRRVERDLDLEEERFEA